MNPKRFLIICAAAMLQLALPAPASAQLWKVSNLATAAWTAVASSTNGVKLVAVASSGQIFTSTNGGGSWITNIAPPVPWTGVASSADGSRLVAVSSTAGIYTNSGIFWGSNFQTSPLATTWQCVGSSANGSNLVAAGVQIISSEIYYSTNAGASWAKATAGNYNLKSIAFAGNGTNVFGAGSTVIASTNAGASWALLNNPPYINYIACATNGLNLAGITTSGNGPIYTSVNGGASWITNTVGQASPWTAVATSADGAKLVAASAASGIYSSADAGAHWLPGDAGGLTWTSVASSADGTALVATATNYIFTGLAPLPTLSLALTGTNASIFWTTNVAGYSLFLVYKTNLTNSLWQFVAPTPVITNNLYRITLPATNNQIFFRLENAG